jgi:hypothetical protein
MGNLINFPHREDLNWQRVERDVLQRCRQAGTPEEALSWIFAEARGKVPETLKLLDRTPLHSDLHAEAGPAVQAVVEEICARHIVLTQGLLSLYFDALAQLYEARFGE